MTVVQLDTLQNDLVRDIRELVKQVESGEVRGIYAVVLGKEDGVEVLYPLLAGAMLNQDAVCWQLTKLARLIDEDDEEEDEDE